MSNDDVERILLLLSQLRKELNDRCDTLERKIDQTAQLAARSADIKFDT